jgi:hypothetical protein
VDCNPLAENVINVNGMGNSIVRLNSGNLVPEQFFAPYDTAWQNSFDKDLGASAMMVLPLEWGTPTHPRLGVTGGKAGNLYLVDLDHLGGFKMSANQQDATVAKWSFTDASPNYSVILSSLALNPVDGYIYATVWGNKIHAMRIQHTTVNGVETWQFIEAGVLQSDINTEPNASTLIVSTNGNTPGTAILWQTGTGRCYAYSGIPDANGKLKQITFMQVGNIKKFHQPAIYKGAVFFGNTQATMFRWG